MAVTGFEQNLRSPIEYSPFLVDDKKEFAQTARLMTNRLRKYGCFPLLLSKDMLRSAELALREYRAFFNLPLEEKLRARAKAGGAAGYTPPGAEKIRIRDEETSENSQKKYFHFQREVYTVTSTDPKMEDSDAYYASMLVWPEGREGFRTSVENPHSSSYDIADDIMSAIAIGSGNARKHFNPLLRGGAIGTRAFRYCKIDPDAGNLAVPKHQDIGLLSILLGVSAPGLEVFDPDRDDCVPVQLPKGQCLVVGGKLLELLSSGDIKAAFHRVVLCPDAAPNRVTVNHFVIGNKKTKLKDALLHPDAANPQFARNPGYLDLTCEGFARAQIDELDYNQGVAAFNKIQYNLG